MSAQNNIDKNYEFFKQNFNDIVKNHIGEFVVIKDCNVIGYYNNEMLAIDETVKAGTKLGDFIVQQCLNNINDNMVHYYTRVY